MLAGENWQTFVFADLAGYEGGSTGPESGAIHNSLMELNLSLETYYKKGKVDTGTSKVLRFLKVKPFFLFFSLCVFIFLSQP
jgi:hypothetical protein